MFLVGWVVDLLRMRYLVKDFNHGREGKSLGTAYILGLSPLGIFGAYHYYLGNVKLGLIYTFTLGIFGIGWIVDLFRMKKLVRKAGLDKRSVGTAYIMSIPPFGLFGAYHYYLGNYGLGIAYTLSLGIFSIGWIVDLFRMKTLVRAANDPTSDHGTTKVTAYILCVSPLGIFGAHHFFLKRYLNGGFYAATFGQFGLGWIFDWFRLPVLYERFADEDKHKYPDEAYMFWFPFGIFGMHHFYLGNKKWGILYACSLGCLLIGWIIDGIRLPWLLKDYNKYIEDPDMNNFRICRPSCSCSVYKCRRRFLNLCSCFEKFSVSRSRSESHDVEMNGDATSSQTKTRDDFDVIQEMYPNENHKNYGQSENDINNETEAEISTVHNNYNVLPNEEPTTPACDNGAHPGDPGYDEQPLPGDDGHDGGTSYPPSYDYGEDKTDYDANEYNHYHEHYQQSDSYQEDNGMYTGDPDTGYDAGYAENPQYASHGNSYPGYTEPQGSDEIRRHEDVNVTVSSAHL